MFRGAIKVHRTAEHKTIAFTMEMDGGQVNDYDTSEEYNDGDGPYDCNHCERNNIQTVYNTNDFNHLIRHIHYDHGLHTGWVLF